MLFRGICQNYFSNLSGPCRASTFHRCIIIVISIPCENSPFFQHWLKYTLLLLFRLVIGQILAFLSIIILLPFLDYERERELEKQLKRERLAKLKCSRGESWVWNPRQFYCQIMCPVCERGSRELTVLHFRNHLELQHTAEEVENVKVCKLCHRDDVFYSVLFSSVELMRSL